jgi:predicted TIM-barrel fold metal-dependent hydrolase
MTTKQSANRSEAGSSRRLTIASSDGHVAPSLSEQLRAYCPAAHLDDFDRYVNDVRKSLEPGADSTAIDFPPEVLERLARRMDVPGLQDPAARLADLDKEGIAAEFLYHGALNADTVPFSTVGSGRVLGSVDGGGPDWLRRLEGVGAHIYNRWLADYVSHDPTRLMGIAHITVRDVDKAVEEVAWARGAGLSGINLPSPRRDFRRYTDREWDRLWAACQDHDMPICCHSGGGDVDTRASGPAEMAVFNFEIHWFGRRGLSHLIFGGAFERYPGLKFVLAEQFGDWIPATLIEMDSIYRAGSRSTLRAELSLAPSEYFARNVFVGTSFMSRQEAELGISAGVVDSLMWGSDYPHAESTFPHTLLSIRKAMAGLPVEVVSAYLGDNVIRVFNLDTRALAEVAERVGPSVEAVMEPYEGRPDGLLSGLAFRDFGRWS